jgi:hypothetical protein
MATNGSMPMASEWTGEKLKYKTEFYAARNPENDQIVQFKFDVDGQKMESAVQLDAHQMTFDVERQRSYITLNVASGECEFDEDGDYTDLETDSDEDKEDKKLKRKAVEDAVAGRNTRALEERIKDVVANDILNALKNGGSGLPAQMITKMRYGKNAGDDVNLAQIKQKIKPLIRPCEAFDDDAQPKYPDTLYVDIIHKWTDAEKEDRIEKARAKAAEKQTNYKEPVNYSTECYYFKGTNEEGNVIMQKGSITNITRNSSVALVIIPTGYNFRLADNMITVKMRAITAVVKNRARLVQSKRGFTGNVSVLGGAEASTVIMEEGEATFDDEPFGDEEEEGDDQNEQKESHQDEDVSHII